MLSPFTDHLVVIDDLGVSWATGNDLQHPATRWHSTETGEPLAACAALLDEVPRAALPYLDRATLVLGYPHVQYLMLPWQENLYSPADWKGFAAALFSQQLSLDPEEWQLEIDHAPFNAPRLAVALSKTLLDDLRALFKAKRFHVQRCTSVLTFALQRYWHEVPPDAVLAVPHGHTLSCGFVHEGRLAQVCALEVAPEAPLRDSLIAMDILAGDRGQHTLVVAAHDGFMQPPTAQPWRWLGPLHPWLGAQP